MIVSLHIPSIAGSASQFIMENVSGFWDVPLRVSICRQTTRPCRH
jgi:hypothetical protein